MDTQLRSLLHDLATEMPVDVEAGAPRTLRKARGRRVLTAGAGAAIVVALVVVSTSVLSLDGTPAPAPAVNGPTPATFAGLWPETEAQSLAETQAAVDEGHLPLRTTPDGTASLLATDLLGWEAPDVSGRATGPTVSDPEGATVVHAISNRTFGAFVPRVQVELRQLGEAGPNGIWSVVGVSSPLIELDGAKEVTPGVIEVSGSVTDLFDAAPALEAHVFDGPTLEPSIGSARHELADRAFAFGVQVAPTPDGRATLLLTMPDATGASLGAVLVSVPTPIGDPEPSLNLTGVPPDVAATAQRIYDAARAEDFDALAQLLDPNTFVYNLDDGSDPIPSWRADPAELDSMTAILELPSTSRDIGEGYGTFSFWPYLVNSDFAALTERERGDLRTLGYSDHEIQLMIDGGNGYQGPRLGIDARGRWRNFITVGE